MPMYYPDLKSVKIAAEQMQQHPNEHKKYKGLIPTTDSDLPEARKQLGAYFREIWSDEIAALEIELSLDENNYCEKLKQHFSERFNNLRNRKV